MKQTMLALALLAVLSDAAAHTGNPDDALVDKAIRREVVYPEFARSQKLHGVVMVQYEIGCDGRVSVLGLDASHPELGEYVKRRLESMRISRDVAAGVRYARFTFRYAGA